MSYRTKIEQEIAEQIRNRAPAQRFTKCEWCCKRTGGALLCGSCEGLQVWGLNDRAEGYIIRTEGSTGERGVLREGTLAARLPIAQRDGVVCNEPDGRRP